MTETIELTDADKCKVLHDLMARRRACLASSEQRREMDRRGPNSWNIRRQVSCAAASTVYHMFHSTMNATAWAINLHGGQVSLSHPTVYKTNNIDVLPHR